MYDDAHNVIRDMANVKMTMNSHKGVIEDVNQTALIQMLRHEVKELAEALEEGNLLHIIEEAADVNNFLVALVQQQINKYRNRKNDTSRTASAAGGSAVEHSAHGQDPISGRTLVQCGADSAGNVQQNSDDRPAGPEEPNDPRFGPRHGRGLHRGLTIDEQVVQIAEEPARWDIETRGPD